MIIIVTKDWRLRMGQPLPMPCDIRLDHAPQRGVATVRIQLSQLLLELETHVGFVRRVRGDDTCGDIAKRVERDLVHFRQQRAHLAGTRSCRSDSVGTTWDRGWPSSFVMSM